MDIDGWGPVSRRLGWFHERVDHRETATLIWLAIALAVMLRNGEIRRALGRVVRALLQPCIFVPLLAYLGWTLGLTALAATVGLWQPDAWGGTVAWFLTAGLAVFFSLDKMSEPAFFRKTVRGAIAATVFVAGFVNLKVFPLPVELVLLPTMTFVGVMSAFSERRGEYAAVHRLASGLMSIVGGCLLLYVAALLITDFEAGRTFRTLALPVWLSIGSLPFAYSVGLCVAYQKAFTLIRIRTDDPRKRRRAKLALLRAATVRVVEVGGFSGHWISDLVETESGEEARTVALRWRASWRAERRASNVNSAKASMREWLMQTEPERADIYADALMSDWNRLDAKQRACLKAEGLIVAPPALVGEVRALPD